MFEPTSMGLAEFGISPATGFLPDVDPLIRLPRAFDAWEEIAHDLPKLLMSDRLRDALLQVADFPESELNTAPQIERAMALLSFIGHAYVWRGGKAARSMPAKIAVPWHAVAASLGRPPVLSYASYCLHNWRRLDPERPVEAGNIALIQNFLGGEDEEWFVIIHVDIEAKAAKAIGALWTSSRHILNGDAPGLLGDLIAVKESLDGINATMNRMPEHCDPYIYYQRVRPYIHGWSNHPDLPEGLIYEGVDAYGGKPQRFRGETGAQSGIVPALDAALGIGHAPDRLRGYLMEMRDYMPPGHKAFVECLESRPSIRAFVQERAEKALTAAYDACVSGVEAFRQKHLEYAAAYIFKQAQTDSKNPHAVGTGGTPFMPYLKKHRDETSAHLLADPHEKTG